MPKINFKKDKLKWLITGISILCIVAVLISVCVSLNRMETTTKVTTNMYSIGTVNETGKVVESKQSIYLTNMQTVDGLDIDISEDTATITYKVVYYDEANDFISITESMSADLDATSIPENAEYFRVVITPYPVDGEAVTISIFNMSKYANQLDITFNK